MNAKLKLDLKQGIIEVEGTEQFVAQIYSEYKERLTATPVTNHPPVSGSQTRSQTEQQPTEEKRRAPASRNKSGSPPAIAKDLDLVARNGQPSLKDFAAPYKPGSAKEWNLLFLYYVAKNERANPVTQDHIYTCYKTMGVKPPEAFSQSLFDTASKKGWLEPNAMVDIKLTIGGENYMEHDFPKKEAAAEK